MSKIAKYIPNNPADGLNHIEKSIDEVNSLLNPLDQQKLNKQPFYQTGATALIKMGGKSLAVTQTVRWNIAYNTTPITTIDSNFPWDQDVGQCTISMELGFIMDPTKGPEHDGLFHVMSSAIHQPNIEVQLINRKFGTQIFYARGMFTGISGRIGIGEVGAWTASFKGVSYQHYVNQNFNPYQGVAGAAGVLLDSLQNLSSDLTGGLL